MISVFFFDLHVEYILDHIRWAVLFQDLSLFMELNQTMDLLQNTLWTNSEPSYKQKDSAELVQSILSMLTLT